MARLHYRKARKDYPANGIKRGDMYYFAQIKTGPRSSRTIRSLTKPRPSQLNTGFAGLIGDIQEDFERIEDVDGLREMAETIRELGSEQQEKFDNMPEGLQQGDVGQLLEERAQECESWADEIDQACDEYETECSNIDEMDAGDLELDEDADESEIADARDAKRDEAFETAKENAASACPF
jgi:hypothetical protein